MKLQVEDGIELVYQTWEAASPKAVLLIVHGMAEHMKRYDAFAQYLADHQIQVFAYDQRGHGETAGSVEALGYFGKSGWDGVVKDVHKMITYINSLYSEVPVILMGHSMGSFIARNYAHLYDGIDGLILSGTGGSSGIQGRILQALSSLQVAIKGPKSKATFISNLTNKAFLAKIKSKRTEFDWLSREPLEVDKYIDDPYCGTVFTCSFYRDLFAAVEFVNSVECVNPYRKTLPIYIFSGSMDPVGNYGKGIKKVEELLKITGQEDLTVRLFENARHEMLNEINKSEVYEAILNWIESKV